MAVQGNKECLILPPKEINHNKTEMDSFTALINFIEIQDITIIMESTSTYHLPLNFFKQMNYAEIVVKKRIDALANFLAGIHQRHPNHYAKKALQIKEAAKNSLFSVKRDSLASEEVIELAQLILNLQDKINAQKLKLIFLAAKCKNFRFVSSMQGLSEYSAALLEAELKDITRFRM